jgi:Holliday junction resolvase RusA-like endonuclease
MTRYDFYIPGPPRAKQRARSTRRGITYTPKETVQYENLVRTVFAGNFPDWIPIHNKTAVEMLVVVCFPIPNAASRKTRELMLAGLVRPTKRPDWDNLGKIVSDSLNEILYHDDCQVCDARVVKIYAETPGVRVEFATIG